MKKNYVLLIFILLCCCFVSCSKTDNSKKTIDEEKKKIDKVSKDFDASKHNNVITLKNGLKDDSLVRSDIALNVNHELDVNIKGEGIFSNHVLVCKDTTNNILYYVNYGYDYFIYRLKDGKSELVVEMPSERLFFVNNKLYFILRSYDIYDLQDVTEGNIFCYDPSNGEVTQITDKNASTMFVYEDGIYYKTQERQDGNVENEFYLMNEEFYYYSFDSATAKKLDKKNIMLYRWNDYFITKELEEVDKKDEIYQIYGDNQILYNTVGYNLETLDGEKKINLLKDSSLGIHSFIDNKFCYMEDERRFITIDIQTGEKKEIILQKECLGDFTILDGKAYFSSLLQVDLESGKQSYITPKKQGEWITELYTDGYYLYGLCGSIEDSKAAVMQRIELEETPDTASMVTDEDGYQYEVFAYSYVTLPIE